MQSSTRFIDRTWMEQQLFEAENAEEPSPLMTRQDTRHILKHHAVPGECLQQCIGVIILGEVSQIGHLLHSHPFSFKAKAIKAAQMFHFRKMAVGGGPWSGRFPGTFTPKDFAASRSDSAKKGAPQLLQTTTKLGILGLPWHRRRGPERTAHG